MINFMYQPAGAKSPHIWSNIILNVSVKVFLDEINISISGLWLKQTALHDMARPHLVGWRIEENKRLTYPKQEELWTWTATLAFSLISRLAS